MISSPIDFIKKQIFITSRIVVFGRSLLHLCTIMMIDRISIHFHQFYHFFLFFFSSVEFVSYCSIQGNVDRNWSICLFDHNELNFEEKKQFREADHFLIMWTCQSEVTYLFDGRSLHQDLKRFLPLEGALMEHFLILSRALLLICLQ